MDINSPLIKVKLNFPIADLRSEINESEMLVKPKKNIRKQYLQMNLKNFNFAYNKCMIDSNEKLMFKFEQICVFYQQEDLRLKPSMFLMAQKSLTNQQPIKLMICINQDNKNLQNLSNTSMNMASNSNEYSPNDDENLNDLLNEFNKKTNLSGTTDNLYRVFP